MSTLRDCLTRFFSHPEAELPQWAIAAKREGRTAESIAAEIRSAGIRIHQSSAAVVRTSSAPVPVLAPSAIDTENRRRLLSLGREVYRDKSFRDGISARLTERAEHATRLEDIRNIGRALLGDE